MIYKFYGQGTSSCNMPSGRRSTTPAGEEQWMEMRQQVKLTPEHDARIGSREVGIRQTELGLNR